MNSCLAVEDRQKLSHVRLMRVHNEKGSARKDELPLVCSGGYRTARVLMGCAVRVLRLRNTTSHRPGWLLSLLTVGKQSDY